MLQIVDIAEALRTGIPLVAPRPLLEVLKVAWASVLFLGSIPVAIFNSYDSIRPALLAVKPVLVVEPLRALVRGITTQFIRDGARVDYTNPAALASRLATIRIVGEVEAASVNL